MQWVCDHMGHSFDVHRTYYRAVSDVLERVQIAKVLLIQDNNVVSKYQGKTLNDIQLEGNKSNI